MLSKTSKQDSVSLNSDVTIPGFDRLLKTIQIVPIPLRHAIDAKRTKLNNYKKRCNANAYLLY